MISSVSISLYNIISSNLSCAGDCSPLPTLTRPHPLPCMQLHPFFFPVLYASLSLVAAGKFLLVSIFYLLNEPVSISGGALFQEPSSRPFLPAKSWCIDLLWLHIIKMWKGSEASCVPILIAMESIRLTLHTGMLRKYIGGTMPSGSTHFPNLVALTLTVKRYRICHPKLRVAEQFTKLRHT